VRPRCDYSYELLPRVIPPGFSISLPHFNDLLEGQHQMILACDRYPTEWAGMPVGESRLRVTPPDDRGEWPITERGPLRLPNPRLLSR
jgi:hypothetical protein